MSRSNSRAGIHSRIQRSQNKDTLAVHGKRNELIAEVEATNNRLVGVEDDAGGPSGATVRPCPLDKKRRELNLSELQQTK